MFLDSRSRRTGTLGMLTATLVWLAAASPAQAQTVRSFTPTKRDKNPVVLTSGIATRGAADIRFIAKSLHALACSPDISVWNAPTTGAVVPLPPANVQGGELPVAVSCTRSDGKPCAPGTTPKDAFPVGSTTVTYQATDAMGKAAHCSFLVGSVSVQLSEP